VTTKKAKSTELVQITASPIPPLRQSLELVMGCPTFYAESVIKGNKMPGGMESARGTQIHEVLARYSAWCATKGVSMDLDAFDRFAKGVGPVAASILAGMRESYKVQFNNLFATEITMALDDDLRPTEVIEAMDGTVADSGKPSTYQGTLDALLFFRDEQIALIDDAKSHPRPYDPEPTLQSKMYALMVFQHFSWVQQITFKLVFVRFSNLSREVTYTRQDVPKLMEVVRSARDRQKSIHADFDAGRELEVIAGGQCVYCPLLANASCPIAKWNPAMQLTPEQRLNFNLWYSAFSKANNKAMKEYVDGTGKNITLKDFNGKAYTFGPKESESQVYPLFKATAGGVEVDNQNRLVMPVVDLLMDYAYAAPEDSAWLGKVQLSSTSLNSYLKTKRRAVLDLAVDDVVEKVTKVKLAVSKPLDALPDEITDDDDEGEEF
jgi:hypothetical protein